MSTRAPINETAVLMAAANIFARSYSDNEDVWAPFLHNRARNHALDECAQMAWELKAAVEKYNPENPDRPRRPIERTLPVMGKPMDELKICG